MTFAKLNAQVCNEEWLRNAKLQLDTYLLSYKPQTGLYLADSIANKIKSNKLDQCDAANWIGYNRGELLELNSRYKEALDLYYSLSSKAKELQNWELFVSSQISIARVMETIGRGEDCFRHLKIAKEYIDAKQVINSMAFYCVRMSSYHRIYSNTDSAYFYAQLAVNYGLKYDLARQIADGYALLGKLTANFDTSYYLLQQSYKQFLINRNYYGASWMANNIYNKLENSNYSQVSKTWLDSIGINIKKIKEQNYIYHIFSSTYYEKLSDGFFKQKRYDSAYFYLKIAKDHLTKGEINVNHTDVSQAEIDYITSSERLKTEALSKQSRYQKILLSILAIVLISILAIVYNINSKKKKIEIQREFIEIQNEKLASSIQKQNILLAEVHHRVKNNLQLVISLLTLHFNKVKNKEEYQYLEEISNKVRSIALIHEHLYSTGEFEKINLISYLKDLLEHYLALHTQDNQFDYILICDQEIKLNLETVMPIGIICTELISNSLKYARPPEQKLILDFKLQSLDSKYILKFHDNGGGSNASNDAKKSGMGTLLIESMVRQLQAQSSPLLNGTSVFNLVFQEKIVSSV